MKNLQLIFLFSVITLCFNSCKKTVTDKKSPQLTIVQPTSGNSYHMFDTVHVSLRLSDNVTLKQLEITLKDNNDVSVQNPVIIALSSSNVNFEFDYILYEFRIPTGDYSLNFSLSDGNNSTKGHATIHIIESPTVKEGYYFISGNNSTHTYSKLDTSYSVINNFVHTGAYIGSAISNYNRQLFTASSPNQPFRCYNINNGNIAWTLANASTGATITSFFSDGTNVFLGKNDANIYKYNSTGTFIKMYNSSESAFYVEHLFCTTDYVIASLSEFTAAPSKKTVVFENATGIVRKVIQNRETMAAFQKSSGEIYLLSNKSTGEAVIEVLSLPGGNLFQTYSFGNIVLNTACQVNSNTLYIALNNGIIYQYNYTGTNVVPVQTGIQAQVLKYNPGFNELYVSSYRNFYVYNAGNFSLTQKSSATLSDTIRGFEVLFNK